MLYNYRCRVCNLTDTRLRRVAERDAPTICTRCGAWVERVIEAPDFQLKGGGWYKDGYSKDKQS